MARDGPGAPARASLCFGLPQANHVALPGDSRFDQVLSELFNDHEARTQEKAILLKQKARECSAEGFWEVMCYGMAELLDAQVSFISTRVTHDRATGNELPPVGDVGSYLNALGLFFHDPAKSVDGFSREVLYKAWDCPCSGMKHGKVFIIPSDAGKFTPDNPNAQFLPFELEAYIGMPCNVKGTSVGHFGVVWTKDGAARRALSWSFIENVLHSFEDMVHARIMTYIEKDSLAHWRSLPTENPASDQSTLDTFKPYAQILSHELRTPMQGIVGPLDVIQSTIQDAAEGRTKLTRKELNSLMEDISAVQSSANRAIDTTEKIIDAYKLDMGRPLKSVHAENDGIVDATIRIPAGPRARRLSMSNAHPRGKKRKYAEEEIREHSFQGSDLMHENRSPSHRNPVDVNIVTEDQRQIPLLDTSVEVMDESLVEQGQNVPSDPLDLSNNNNNTTSGLTSCNVKDLVRDVVDYSSKKTNPTGDVIDEETSEGHVVRASYKQANGDWHFKTVAWSVADEVPETVLVREADLRRLVELVFENALKFTTSADIELKADVDETSQFIVFYVSDTGPGIRPQLQPRIFQPFTQGDNSITRSSEGVGLGLLVAKGLADKLGGDVILARSETEGEEHGSEFHIRIPVTPPGLQTPRSQGSGPPSVAGTAPVPTSHRRGSSGSSHLLRIGQAPAQPGYQPFGQLSDALITPASSTNVSPKMESVPGASEQQYAGVTEAKRGTESTGDDAEKDPPLTLLVVEDNDMIRLNIVRMLTKLGHEPSRIFQACDGADAIRQVTELHKRHAEEVRIYGTSRTPPIDLVLMDLWMPEVDGYEATKRILALYSPEDGLPTKTSMRRCVSEPGTVPLLNADGVKTIVTHAQAKVMIPPTIFGISADATDDASARATQVGMSAFVPKPFKLKTLEKFIEEAKANRAQARKSGNR